MQFETDLEVGDLVQTDDGMLHRVVDVQLMAWIKPIAPTDAPIMGFETHMLKKWNQE